jgi:hypothetical protein
MRGESARCNQFDCKLFIFLRRASVVSGDIAVVEAAEYETAGGRAALSGISFSRL